MKKRKHYSIILLLICLSAFCMSSCTPESSDYRDSEEVEVTLVLSTRLGASTRSAIEEQINTLRVIVFEVRGNDNDLRYIRQIKNEICTAPRITVNIQKCEKVRVILIANECTEWGLNDKNKTIDNIKNQNILSYLTGPSNQDVLINEPLHMFGESRTMSGQENNEADILLERNAARVDLTLSSTVNYLPSLSQGTLKLKEAYVCNMAPKAGLGEAYTNIAESTKPEEYLSSQKNEFNYTSTADGSFTTNTLTFYVPEHVVTRTDLYTYIMIKGEFCYKTGGTTSVEYQLPVGNSITTEKIKSGLSLSDLRINRNYLYDMKAIITSLKQVSEVTVKTAE